MIAKFHDPLCYSREQRQITADVGLDVQGGDFRPEQQTADVARHAKIDQPGLYNWVDDDNLAAAASDAHKRPHESWVVARRISSDQENEVRPVEIFELYRSCTAAGYGR